MHHFSLGWTGVSAVLASLVVLFAFSCIGAIVGKHRDFRAADPLIGWGIATGFLTIVGVAFPGWLPHAALVLGAASIFAMMLAFRRKELPGGKIFWASVLLAVPWLLLIVSQNVAEWDDFTHWLPNASYLYRFAAFPRTDLPAPISFWPAYPYGLPLWHWLTSLVAGHHVEMAAAMANLLLLISFGGLVMEALDREGGARRGRAIWGMVALAVLLATVGNPSFVRSYALTAYTDSATAVTLAAGILTLAMGVGALWPRTSMLPSLQKGLVNTGIVLAVVVPILTVTAAKHLVNWPKGDFATASRVGGEVTEMLPPGSSVTIAARGDSGLAQRIVAYALWHPGEEDRQLRVRGHIPLSAQPLSQEMLAATTTDYLLLLGSAGSLAQDAIGDQTSSAVFAKRSEGGFDVLRRW